MKLRTKPRIFPQSRTFKLLSSKLVSCHTIVVAASRILPITRKAKNAGPTTTRVRSTVRMTLSD
jgi:hypothetical protein